MYQPQGIDKAKGLYQPMILVSETFIVPPLMVAEITGIELKNYVEKLNNPEVTKLFQGKLQAEQTKSDNAVISSDSMSEKVKEGIKKGLGSNTKYFASGMLIGLTGMLILGTFTKLAWWKAALIGVGGGLVTGYTYSKYKKSQGQSPVPKGNGLES